MRLARRVLSPVVSPVGRFFGRRSKLQLGVMFLVAIGLCSLGLFNKSRLLVNLQSGEHISADFAGNYKLRQYVSGVKIAGVKVGTVTHVAGTGQGAVRVDMRVKPGTSAKLGAAPSARIRPTTILGGSGLSVYVDLRPGAETPRAAASPVAAASIESASPGRFDGHIPAGRTSVPVELDRVLGVFTDVPRHGFSSALGAFDQALANGGGDALGHIAERSPTVLPAATDVMTGLSGNRPGDLAALVSRLGRTAATLTATDGELESVLSDAATVSATLGRRAGDFEALLAGLPADLTQARSGLDALSGTLDRLRSTAPGARETVTRLGALLDAAQPVLAEARPLLADARPLLADLDPLFARLAPTTSAATKVLDDFDGPVIGRIRDPILTTFGAPRTGAQTRLYQEFGYFLAGLDGALKYTDPDGAGVLFHGGGNENTVSGGRP